MAMFGMGKKAEAATPKVTTPVDEVLRMREQGFTNNQIVQTLQRNGYKTHQIFDAMNQSDLRSAGPIEDSVPPELAQQPMPESSQEESLPDLETRQGAAQPQENYDERVEELAESIIEEKWEDLMKDINKLLEWKEAMENKMAAIEQSLKDLKGSFEILQKSVIGKVAEYDKTMKEVGIDVRAMDTVFKKVLPTLTDNVNELSRLTRKAKGKKYPS